MLPNPYNCKRAISDIESVMGYGASYLYFSFENRRKHNESEDVGGDKRANEKN